MFCLKGLITELKMDVNKLWPILSIIPIALARFHAQVASIIIVLIR